MGRGDSASLGPARPGTVSILKSRLDQMHGAEWNQVHQDHLEENQQLTCDDFTQLKHVGLSEPPLAPRDQSHVFLQEGYRVGLAEVC